MNAIELLIRSYWFHTSIPLWYVVSLTLVRCQVPNAIRISCINDMVVYYKTRRAQLLKVIANIISQKNNGDIIRQHSLTFWTMWKEFVTHFHCIIQHTSGMYCSRLSHGQICESRDKITNCKDNLSRYSSFSNVSHLVFRIESHPNMCPV